MKTKKQELIEKPKYFENEDDLLETNFSQSLNKFCLVFNGKLKTGGFLPQEVKDDFIRSARSSFEAKNTQYYNIKAEKAKQINQRLGIENGADYLTSYESAAPLTQIDFGIADTLSGASEQDIQDIMFYVNNGALPNSSAQY